MDGLDEDQLKAAEKAEFFAQQVSHPLTQPYCLEGRQQFLNVSQGLVLFKGREESIDSLFQYANSAVHLAKRSGQNGLRFYDPEVQAQLESRTELERDLRLAIEQEEFVLVYQMQVDNQGRAIGAEALIRWQHPDVHQDADDMAIVETIIAMGRSLGLDVIAEGVETIEHWRYLNAHQCHAYQGYYFCKPVAPEEMAKHCLAPPPVPA